MKICQYCFQEFCSHGEKLIIMEHSYDEIICDICKEADEEYYIIKEK